MTYVVPCVFYISTLTPSDVGQSTPLIHECSLNTLERVEEESRDGTGLANPGSAGNGYYSGSRFYIAPSVCHIMCNIIYSTWQFYASFPSGGAVAKIFDVSPG